MQNENPQHKERLEETEKPFEVEICCSGFNERYTELPNLNWTQFSVCVMCYYEACTEPQLGRLEPLYVTKEALYLLQFHIF